MKALSYFLLTLALGAGLSSRAEVVHSIQSLQLTNYTGYVIDADAQVPGAPYNREHLIAESKVTATNSDAFAVLTQYFLRYRLLNSAGTPHPLYDSTGVLSPDATYSVTNGFGMAPESAVSRTNVASLRPATRLSAYDRYTVELRVFVPGNVRERDTRTNSPQTFYHFTNLVSGDVGLNVIATANDVEFSRRYAVRTDPDKRSFFADVDYTVRRYDAFSGSGLPLDEVPVTLQYQLVHAVSGTVIPLVSSETNFIRTAAKHNPFATDPILPVVVNDSQTVEVRPVSGFQLDSVDGAYRLVVSVSHLEQQGVPNSVRAGNAVASPSTQLLHFSGNLQFGELNTTFTSIDNDPVRGATVPGSHVNSTLGVDNQSGSIPAIPGVTYGDGTDLSVRLLSNGDAVALSNSGPIVMPPGADTEVENVQVQLIAPASLTTNGLVSGLRVYLPTGMGFRANVAGHILQRSFKVASVPLGANLRPLSDVLFSPGGPIFVVEETKPLWLRAGSILWQIDQGRFEVNVVPDGALHVRADKYATLSAVDAILDNSERGLKRSNDRYYESVQSIATPVVVVADTNQTALVSFNATLGAGEFRTHFPYDGLVPWDGGGTLQVEQDQVVAESSQLTAVDPIFLSYGTGCIGADCGLGATSLQVRLTPENAVLHFTPDGGLVAGGGLFPPVRLRWGYIAPLNQYAHEALTFNDANFHMPGHFLRGDQTILAIPYRAAAMLYTGVAATNLAYLERPDQPGTANQDFYERGDADYAGMNFAVASDGAQQGQSVIAGMPTDAYQLRSDSKYYARRGGVSGIHDAVDGTFPDTLMLYGYTFNFDHFAFNQLDNRMRDSWIDGRIDIPYPSGFVQPFAGLRLNCLGGIEGAPMPEPTLDRPLVYWNGKFDSLALQFRRDPEDVCNVTNAFLALGVRTGVAHVKETLLGTLGFLPDGNLIPRAQGLEDIDSRLKLPNVIRLAGPRDEEYVLNPVVDVYFNTHSEATGDGPTNGWVNIAASINVPFFEDLRVHVQTSANTNSPNAPIYMMGGWPTHGWELVEGNYFTADYFDDTNRGYGGVSPMGYRNSQTEQYHARAQCMWLDVIRFDYPLVWSDTTRSFRAQAPIVRDLMVLSTENELKYLSAKNAEITFGAQFEGLPMFNLANLAFQALDLATQAGNEFFSNKLNAVVGGFGRLDEILSADLAPFLDGVFDEKIDPRIQTLYSRLQEVYSTNAVEWHDFAGEDVELAFKGAGEPILDRLIGLAGDNTDTGIMKRLLDHLTEATNAVGQIESVLAEDPEGNRAVASQLMRLLVDNLAAQFAAGFVDQFVQPILAEADPTLDQIHLTLSNLRLALTQIIETLEDPAGMGAELSDLLLANAPVISVAVDDMIEGVGTFVKDIDLTLDSPFADYTPEEFTHVVRQEIEDQFLGTPVAAAMQVVHKQRLYDPDAAIRQATDTVFQELNNVIRSVISQTAEELTSAFTEFLDPLRLKAAAAKINGYAHINGDSLKEARVDLHARLDLGTALEFNGYVQIKELDSTGNPGCDYGGEDSITEVSLGAEDVQVGWISPELRASVFTKFTFAEIGNGFPLRGLAGGFDLTGKLDYEAFSINFLGASLAFGQEENFISGAAGMRVNKYDVFGGIFFGRACSLAPLQLWDSEVANLLGGPTFTGIYGYGEGWIPVNELIGIPASCLFNISAGLGMGAGVFLEGPTFVAKMTAGVSGEALCMVGIKGQLQGTGVLEGLDLNVLDGLTVKAKGTVGGKFGPCPLCLEVEQSVALTFKQGKWKLDF